MRCVIIIIFISALTLASAEPRAAPRTRVVNAQNLAIWQAEVRQSHPSVAAARARAEAARAAVGAVRLWEDPMVGLGLTAARRAMRRDNGDITLMAEQQLPRQRLYSAQREKALSAELASRAEVAVTSNMLELEVAKTALELALSDETLAIQEQQLTWVDRMTANARERLKDPTASAAEPLRLESELSQERQKLAAGHRERTRLAQQLNLLLGRPVGQSWGLLSLPSSAAEDPEIRNEWQSLIALHPRLAALRHIADAAGAGTAVARAEQKPVVTLSLESSAWHGGDFRDAMFGVRVTLPWWNRSVYYANEERTRREYEAAQRDIATTERELGSKAVMAITEAQNASRQAAAYAGEVLPAAEKAAQAVETAWVSTKATLAEVLEARRSLLMARMEQRRFVAAREAARATLRSLRGGR